MKPTTILEKRCKEADLEQPIYEPGCVIVDEQRFYEKEVVENDQGFLWSFFVLHCLVDMD